MSRLTAYQKELDAQLRAANELQDHSSSIGEKRKNVTDLRQEVRRMEGELNARESDIAGLNRRRLELSGRTEELARGGAAHKDRLRILEEILTITTDMADVERQLGSLNQASARLAESRDKMKSQIATLREQERKDRMRVSEFERERASLGTRLANLIALRDELKLAQDEAQRAAAVRGTVEDLTTQQRQMLDEVEVGEREIRSIQVDCERFRNQIKEGSAKADACHQLLIELRQFVKNEECPVCATRFDSRDTLLTRLDSKIVAVDPELGALSSELQSRSLQVEQAGRNQEVRRAKVADLTVSIQANRAILDQVETRIRKVAELARECELAIQLDNKPDLTGVESRIAEGRARMLQIQAEDPELRDSLGSCSQELSRLDLAIRSQEESAKDVSGQIAELSSRIKTLENRRDELTLRVPLKDLIYDAVVHERDQSMVDIRTNEKERSDIVEVLTGVLKRIEQLEREIAPLKARRDEVQQAERDLLHSEEHWKARVTALGLDSGPNFEKDLAAFLTARNTSSASAESALASAKHLEASLEAGRESLRIDRLDQELATIKDQRAGVTQRISRLQEARSIANSLIEKVRNAAEDRTKEILKTSSYLTEHYFNRVYPHPLWSRLELSVDSDPTRGGRTQLRMTARREGRPPAQRLASDYNERELNVKYSFSTGQLNLFAISLFLAFSQHRVSESFAPLFLDDPVQAMDDMRIAELCWVFLQRARKRQVVLATGHQNLVELLLKRGAPIAKESSIVVHRFECMTPAGPVIRQQWRSTLADQSTERVA
jgi:chromosome segregation ATPase